MTHEGAQITVQPTEERADMDGKIDIQTINTADENNDGVPEQIVSYTSCPQL